MQGIILIIQIIITLHSDFVPTLVFFLFDLKFNSGKKSKLSQKYVNSHYTFTLDCIDPIL